MPAEPEPEIEYVDRDVEVIEYVDKEVEVEKIVEVEVFNGNLTDNAMIGVIIGSTIVGIVLIACLCCCLTATCSTSEYYKQKKASVVKTS